MNTERLFLAIALPECVRDSLTERVRPAAERAERVRWVRSENLHMTLKFLGEVTGERRTVIVEVMERVVTGSAPFPVTVSGVRIVRRRGRPHMVWGVLADPNDSLRQLHEKTECLLAHSGFDRERRPLAPHVTLARVRQGIAAWEAEQLESWVAALEDSEAMEFTVESVALMRSELRPGGAEYTVCRRFPLRNT